MKAMNSYEELKIDANFHKIDGYNSYFVTDDGRVFSVRHGKTGWNGVRQLKLRGLNNPKRYLQVCLCESNIRKYAQVHRLVAKYFCDGYFDGAVVNHLDGNIHNNHYTNLEWVSQKENIHKSYISSGKNQVRNFNYYSLICPSGEVISDFIGRNQAVAFIRANGIDASPSSLIRNGESRGYKLLKTSLLLETQTTIPSA